MMAEMVAAEMEAEQGMVEREVLEWLAAGSQVHHGRMPDMKLDGFDACNIPALINYMAHYGFISEFERRKILNEYTRKESK